MIDSTSIQLRDVDRSDIDKAIQAFLAQGGKVDVLSHCERAPFKPISYNNRVDRKPTARREYLELERKIAEHGKSLADIGLTVDQARRQMTKRWKGQAILTTPKVEQIAAKYGYSFNATGKP